MKALIEKYDHIGRGIAYVNNKVTFVPKVVVGDYVDLEIIKEKKNYQEAKVIKIIKPSNSRVDHFCPYYALCGGCSLQNMSYQDTLKYKKEKIENILQRIKENIKIEVIENDHPLFYRDKITLQVRNKVIGFYREKTMDIIPIDECPIASKSINNIIPLLKDLNIINGQIIIRSNLNQELLIIIKSNDKLKIDINKLKEKNKIAGIVLNDQVYYNDSFLIEVINKIIYKITYDAFFQVNPFVASKLFNLIKENITEDDLVLDLYCGVGTLSLNASLKAKKVLGIEVVPSAVINATYNAKINKLSASFVLNKVEDALTKINFNFNTVIIDPPRKGLDSKTLNFLLKQKVPKIIYVSCDPQTLVRDLQELKKQYNITKFYILDMFSYTYHVECVCVLNLR